MRGRAGAQGVSSSIRDEKTPPYVHPSRLRGILEQELRSHIALVKVHMEDLVYKSSLKSLCSTIGPGRNSIID